MQTNEQYRCIPYKFEKNDENKNCKMEKKVLVLMISTPNRDDLVFPKVPIYLLILLEICPVSRPRTCHVE